MDSQYSIDLDGNESWSDKHGRLHRLDGPAWISRNKEFWCYKWFKNGQLHRRDGPAFIMRFPGKDYVDTEWWLKGRKHRIDGPARVYHMPNNLIQREWWVKGLPHRDHDDPAIEVEDANNSCFLLRMWYQNGIIHRSCGCSIESNKEQYQAYHINGKLHNASGYSQQWFKTNDHTWHINGIDLTKSIDTWLNKSHYMPNNPNDWTGNHKMLFKLTWC